MAIKFRELSVVCPSCDRAITTKTVASTSSQIVAKATDFHDRYRLGESVLPYYVHFCADCGFCAEERFFNEDYDIGFKLALRDYVQEYLAPNIKWAREYLVDRFYHAAKLAEFCEDSPVRQGDLALRGAWAAVEERDYESERYFRRIAVNNYTLALQHYDMVEPATRAQMTYLIGELWRRIGDESLAELWFEAVENAVVNKAEQQWVLALAEKQRRTPQDYM